MSPETINDGVSSADNSDTSTAANEAETRELRSRGLDPDAARAQLALLAKLGGAHTTEDALDYRGDRIILPERMRGRIDLARDFLRRVQEAEDTPTDFTRTFPYRPWDGARATMRAFRRAFGAALLGKGTAHGFFGSFKVPPQLVDVPVGYGETEQVPWGGVEIPILPGVEFHLGQAHDDEHGLVFRLSVIEAPRKHRFVIEGLFALVEEELRSDSLYRGKAFDGATMPNFLNLAAYDPERIVYSGEAFAQVEANVLAALRYPDVLDAIGAGSKRAVLLSGPFGTGKTSTAYLIAQEAVRSGWTFILARPGVDDLDDVFRTARLYEPCVVFFEDLDRIADPTELSGGHVTRLLDHFDGVTAKGARLLAVLTTNYPERIHKGMVRPGRLDAIIELGAPDGPAITKLVKVTVPDDRLDAKIDWDRVATAMDGYLPAFIREASERAIRYALVQANGDLGKVVIGTDELVRAADGLRPQWRLMQDAPEDGERDNVGAAIRRHVLDAMAVGIAYDSAHGFGNGDVKASGNRAALDELNDLS